MWKANNKKAGISRYFCTVIEKTCGKRDMSEEKKSGSKRLILILIIIALIILNGVFIYVWNTNRQLKEESQRLLLQKEIEYQKAIGELNLFKGKNDQLDSLVSAANAELAAKSSSLDSLLKSNKVTAQQIERFKRENGKLNYYKQLYLEKIDSLIRANENLQVENQQLRTEIRSEQRRAEILTDENVKLSNKVALGAILKVQNISIEGIRLRSGGKEVTTNRARSTEKLKACFTIGENRVANRGNKAIYLRVIGPEGATLWLEDAGSGKFMAEGQETLYTAVATIDYQNESLPVCIYWTKGTAFLEGTYKAEIYADGYLIGETNFTLR